MSATYLSSLQDGLRSCLAKDDSVVVMGEDIVDPYGGAFKVTKGLSTDYPDRVLSTPISEGTLTGMAAGMAMRGKKPVVEIMFGDFLTLCTDQIVNHMAKFRGMFGNDVSLPCVLRTPMGGGRGYGATHSQSIEKIILGTPDIRVVAPSNAHNPGDMLRDAVMNCDDPVLFLEHKLLYPQTLLEETGDLSVELIDESSGFPTAILRNHDGDADLTIISYGGMSRLIAPLMAEMAQEEIYITTTLPGSLQPVPVETLVSAARETDRVLVIEEGTAGFNWGSEIAALISEQLHGALYKPVKRLSSADSVIPASEAGEKAALVGTEDIEAAILEMLA